jgi:hypothetical protein
MKGLFTPPYSQLTAIVAAIVAVAAEFTDPASAAPLLALIGPHWTKYLVAVCVLVVMVSKAVERNKAPQKPKVVPWA